MNGELAQVITLAVQGNTYLGSSAPAPELFPSHSVFRFVREVAFIRTRRRLGLFPDSRVVARGTGEWFTDLRKRGAQRFRLWTGVASRGLPAHILPAHIAAAFTGGNWVIQVDLPDHYEAWVPSWNVTRGHDSEQRIWSVTYQGRRLERPLVSAEEPVQRAGEALTRALSSARQLASEAGYDDWIECFREAERALSDPSPEIPYHPDLLPPSTPPDVQRLLAGASKAWVFGGMGSWNDLYLQDPRQQQRYEQVSQELYMAVLAAARAGTNSARLLTGPPAA